jgi:AcrR family transcriptional regulator
MTPRYKNDSRKHLMAETRVRLVNAAIEEFAREGFDGANINHITQTAGVATGTIYNYFHSKNDLMMAILSEIGTAHIAYIAEQIRLEDDFIIRVEKLFIAGFEYLQKIPYQANVLFTMLQGTNMTFKQHLNQIYQPMFLLISDEILIPGMQRGIFQQLDPASTTLMIMTFYLGIGSIVDKNGDTSLDLKEVAAFVLRALGTKQPANS